jgi:exosortase
MLLSRLSTKDASLALAAIGLLWLILINELRIAWSANPQYSYGWVVPFLCLGLLLRRWQAAREEISGQRAVVIGQQPEFQPTQSRHPDNLFTCSVFSISFFCFAAFLILPLRLVLEANPSWRTLDWLLACCVIALSLMTVWRSLGPGWARQFAFPVCFILIAVAWPPSIEIPIIQGLTRANVATTIESVGWLGIPASQHGNVIEISTGMVGVNDACSGIRSFQTSIMISLFMGEFYRLSLRRRLLLLPAGFIAAFAFNVCRTSLLVMVASKKGVAAIESWHDPAGVTITIACTLVLWGVAVLFNKKRKAEILKAEIGARSLEIERQKPESRKQKKEASDQKTVVSGQISEFQFSKFQLFSIFPLSLALLIWLVTVEVGVELWYRSHEWRSAKTPEWTLTWPPRESTFQESAVPEVAHDMLQYNEGHYGTWSSELGSAWAMYYFRWMPGKNAMSAARGHSPDICLTAAGKVLHQIEDNRCPMTIGSLVLPFRRYEFDENGRTIHVFHCLWEDHAPSQYFEHDTKSGMMGLRINAVLEGRRNLGQRSIEIMVSGIKDAKTAQAAVASQLSQIVRVENALRP